MDISFRHWNQVESASQQHNKIEIDGRPNQKFSYMHMYLWKVWGQIHHPCVMSCEQRRQVRTCMQYCWTWTQQFSWTAIWTLCKCAPMSEYNFQEMVGMSYESLLRKYFKSSTLCVIAAEAGWCKIGMDLGESPMDVCGHLQPLMTFQHYITHFHVANHSAMGGSSAAIPKCSCGMTKSIFIHRQLHLQNNEN